MDKDKTTIEKTKSTKRYGGWGMEFRQTHGHGSRKEKEWGDNCRTERQ